jgi:hypothetical protein
MSFLVAASGESEENLSLMMDAGACNIDLNAFGNYLLTYDLIA